MSEYDFGIALTLNLGVCSSRQSIPIQIQSLFEFSPPAFLLHNNAFYQLKQKSFATVQNNSVIEQVVENSIEFLGKLHSKVSAQNIVSVFCCC